MQFQHSKQNTSEREGRRKERRKKRGDPVLVLSARAGLWGCAKQPRRHIYLPVT